ncbi:hypothetical protein [Streptomyces sp. WG5]|uniref:hypothetical protein n=1 Tax=Streptomyces sp. WG5 TaxID=3417648 RepID=UPI003CF200A1
MLQEFSDELEADLMEFFQEDLNDLFRGRLSFRKLGSYIKSLMRKPGRSVLLMAMDEAAGWSPEMYIAARMSDALEVSNYLFIQANSSADAEPIEAPQPITRPGQPEVVPEKPKTESFASGQEVAAFFNRMSS